MREEERVCFFYKHPHRQVQRQGFISLVKLIPDRTHLKCKHQMSNPWPISPPRHKKCLALV